MSYKYNNFVIKIIYLRQSYILGEMTKKEIRQLMKTREMTWASDPCQAELETSEIWETVEAMPQFISARTVLIYMDMPGEVPTRSFIEKWKDRKDFVIPRVEGEDLRLYLFDASRLRSGYRGIAEPYGEAVSIDPCDIDLALVPGVAFSITDGKVWRLGRGKGFYDRLLAGMHCPKIGIFQPFRLLDALPLDPWDQPLDL